MNVVGLLYLTEEMDKVQRKKITSRCAVSLLRGRYGTVYVSVQLPSLICQVFTPRKTNKWMNECEALVDLQGTVENRSIPKETCSGYNLTTRNPARTYLWLTPDLRSEKPANNCLSHGTTAVSLYSRRPFTFLHASYLILSLDVSIIVWIRIQFSLDMILLKLRVKI